MKTLYHGSSRQFNKFDLKEAGNGDGRSVGGWGIYFNSIREVALEYVIKGGALYTCHVYEDGFWFDLDEEVDQDTLIRIHKRFVRMGLPVEDTAQFHREYMNDEAPVTGEQVYKWLAVTLESERNASSFLRAIGSDGNTFLDRGTVDAASKTDNPELLENGKGRNYVLFDEDNLSIRSMETYDELQYKPGDNGDN
jgi:hypothetical protein